MPFEVPEGWCWTTLQDISFLIEDCPHTTAPDEGCGYPLVRTPNIGEGYLILEGVHRVSEETYNKRNIRAVPQTDDIVYAREAPAGNAAVIKKEEIICLGQRTVLIRPAKNYVDSNLLAYFILSPYSRNRLISKATGSTVQHVNMESIRPHLIPLPPYNEQLRIVDKIKDLLSIVDELSESEITIHHAVYQAKSKILDLAIHGKLVPQNPNDEPASELLKRINPKAVASCDNPHYAEPYELPDGWIWCKLTDLCTFLSRGKSPKYSETDTTYPVFAQKCNLKEGGISLEKAQFLEPATLNRWPDVYHLRTGDVLVNSTGTGTVGRTRFFNESCLGDYPFVVPDSHVSVIRTYDDIVSEYIFALMSSSWIQAYLEDNLAGSTNQKELYIGVLQNVDVPLPPIKEQRRISDKIESLYQQLDSITTYL